MRHSLKFIVFITFICLCFACGDDRARRGSGGPSGPSGPSHPPGGSATLQFDDVRLSAARFSPDGTRLVLSYQDEDGEYNIATMDTDGSRLELLAGGGSYLTAPTWSRDGTKIIFYRDGIERMNLDGSDVEPIDNAFAAMGPDISPDGTLMTYGINGSTIRIHSLDAEEPNIVTDQYGSTPRFSPDGTLIAYANAGGLFVMDLHGENVREIATDDLSYLSSVAWFPDGERLAVTTDNGVEIIDVASGSRTQAIDGFATMEVDVSPDGRVIIYGINGQSGLKIVSDF
ncbi:MAG: TolB family protein [Bradymonadaceae bacterium]